MTWPIPMKLDDGRDRVFPPLTIEEIRARIHRYSRDDILTRRVMGLAQHRGLSGEDTMTLLAYEALKAAERLLERQLEMIRCYPPAPLFIVKQGVIKPGDV